MTQNPLVLSYTAISEPAELGDAGLRPLFDAWRRLPANTLLHTLKCRLSASTPADTARSRVPARSAADVAAQQHLGRRCALLAWPALLTPPPLRCALPVTQRDMATQGDARAVAVAESEPLTLAALPRALFFEVLSRVPVDCRMRCREVCRAWRTALNDCSAWRRLDLSTATGGLARHASDAVLRAAAARAGRQLQSLDVSDCHWVSPAALLRVARINSGALRELHMRTCKEVRAGRPHHEPLLRAASRLRACYASQDTSALAVARAMLRGEPPFAALRLDSLHVGDNENNIEADAVLGLASDLSACTFIRELHLRAAALDVPAALDALVDAACACRLHTLRLDYCSLSAASAPALARLLGGGALAELEIYGLRFRDPLDPPLLFLDAPATAVLADALRACSTLTALTLRHVDLWHDPGATAVLGALTGHASLRTLDLSHDHVHSDAAGAAVRAALDALVGANAPALTELDVSCCNVGRYFPSWLPHGSLRKLLADDPYTW